jgi:pimeloyl-[acyl-carrier protein] methyl ester esterase
MTRDIVLINGWGMASAVWRDTTAALRGYTLRFIDLDQVLGEADCPLQRIARLAPARCHVVGWSLGAQLALQWAHAAPEQVESLALIAATPSFVQRERWTAAMDTAVFEAFVAQFEGDAAQALGRFALLQARGEQDMTRVARALRDATCAVTSQTRAALDAGLALLRTNDLRPLLHEIRLPVQLLHGADDALVPAAAAQRLQQALPNARLRLLRSTGHAPHVSDPAAVAAQLREVFRER